MTDRFFMACALLTTFQLGVAPAPLLAQKGEKQINGQGRIFQSKTESLDFMKSIKKEASTNPELKTMLPLINDVVLGRPIGSSGKGFKGNPGLLNLLSDSRVRQELEMVESQFEDLKRMQAEIQDRAARELKRIDFSDRKNLSARIRGIGEKAEQDIEALLLPHQKQRLQQIATRAQVGRRSLARYLTADPVKSDLSLTEEQSDTLLETEAKIEAKLQKEIEKLREQAREDLLSILDRKQREKVDQMLGDPFRLEGKKKDRPDKPKKPKKEKQQGGKKDLK